MVLPVLLHPSSVIATRLLGFAGLMACALAANAAQAQENSPDTAPPPSETGAKDETDTSGAGPDNELIISDDDFASSMPELTSDDPELTRELEPLDIFQQRYDAHPLESATQLLEESDAASPEHETGRQEALLLPDFKDPDLAAPLPPLATFETLPLDFSPVDFQTEVSTTTLRYDWQLTGIEAVNALTQTDLAEQFEDLSALEKGDGTAANTAMLLARLEDDKAIVRRIMRAEGWYLAEVESSLDSLGLVGSGLDSDGSDRKVAARARIHVNPGPRFTLADIVIEAGTTEPPDLIASILTIKPGDPIAAASILLNEAVIAQVLPENGYPFAKIGSRQIVLNAQSAQGVYTLPVETGPRARIGDFAVSGDGVFDAEHIAVMARFASGDLYDSRELDDLRRALAATTLLRSFSVEPQITGQDADNGTEYVTIEVNQTQGPARTLAGAIGYGTGQGLRVEGSWAHRNLFPPEGALTASILAGTLEQGAGLSFRRANAGQRDRTFDIGLSALRSNFDAFEATTGRIGATYSYVSTPIWQKRVTYAFGVEALASVEEAFDIRARAITQQTYLIGAAFAQIGFDTSDDLLNPTRGFRLEALVQPEGSLEGGFTPYVRTILDASGYVPASNSVVLAGRARFGTLQGADGVDIAPSRRLYAGGGGSVRGFGFQELGPRARVPNENFDPTDPDETEDPFTFEPIGGRSVIEASAEARYRFGDYGVVAFVDAGQVYRDTVPAFSDVRFGVGIGGRIYTNFGPVRVDIATPIHRRKGEARVNVYVSIGQAF